MEDLNVKVLDEVNKGTTMGMDAIKYVSEKVGDETFRKVLDVEYGKYKKIAQRVDEIYPQYSTKEPQETNTMNKMMTWYGVQMKTMSDQSNSKISELLLQGTNMGIIEGTPVKCVLCGSCGLKAFLIRGAVYALRKEDAENIIIE